MRKIPAGSDKSDLPVRERRCIFAAACFAALAAAVVVPTMLADGLPTIDGAEEEDMSGSCTGAQ
jgi:hypothetical protein